MTETSSTSTNGSNKKNGEKIVPPDIHSGFLKRKTDIVGLFVGLTTVYASIYYGYRDSETGVFGMFKPAPEYCENNDAGVVCSRSDLFAFQVGSGLAIIFCGVLGFYTWHITKRVHTVLPNTPAGRLYGYLPESETLCMVNFTFQVWDFFISLLIPEHRGLLMLFHHIAAATVCFLALHYQVLHYYAVFFVGVTEFSSLFLLVIDIAKYFPPQDEGTGSSSIYETICSVAGPLFAVAFTIYRIVWWIQESYRLYKDCYDVVVRTNISNALRPGKNFVLYMFLGLNFPLTLLQFYWFSIILGEVKKLVVGS